MTVLELSALGAWARLNLPLAREGGAVRVVRGDSPVAEVERELDSIILAQMPAAIVALADRVKALEAVAAAARVVIDSADALDFDWRYGALADDGGQEAVSAAALLALERRVKR